MIDTLPVSFIGNFCTLIVAVCKWTCSKFGFSHSSRSYSYSRRPHKTDPKTLKRIIWEIYHINAGRIALILALINISLGVFLAVVPYNAWVIWFVMFAVWVAILIFMEVRLQYSRYTSGEGRVMEMTTKWSRLPFGMPRLRSVDNNYKQFVVTIAMHCLHSYLIILAILLMFISYVHA